MSNVHHAMIGGNYLNRVKIYFGNSVISVE